MTVHYHGTPITSANDKVLYELAGRHFCVRYGAHKQVEICHRIGQSVMIDNGAFSFWRKGTPTDWNAFFKWVRPWLDFKSTWVVIPDVIDGTEEENDALIEAWDEEIGTTYQGVPVWHLHESVERLDELIYSYEFPRVCFGSSGQYAVIGSERWNNRLNEVFNYICAGSGSPPCAIHMLRGLSLSASVYPFASVDSTDIARNHNRPGNTARAMADRWDSLQCRGTWTPKPTQTEMELA